MEKEPSIPADDDCSELVIESTQEEPKSYTRAHKWTTTTSRGESMYEERVHLFGRAVSLLSRRRYGCRLRVGPKRAQAELVVSGEPLKEESGANLQVLSHTSSSRSHRAQDALALLVAAAADEFN